MRDLLAFYRATWREGLAVFCAFAAWAVWAVIGSVVA